MKFDRRIYVIWMADERFEWVICDSKLCTRLYEARHALAEIKEGWPGRKFKIVRYEPVSGPSSTGG